MSLLLNTAHMAWGDQDTGLLSTPLLIPAPSSSPTSHKVFLISVSSLVP
jgi:hypothetical protein